MSAFSWQRNLILKTKNVKKLTLKGLKILGGVTLEKADKLAENA